MKRLLTFSFSILMISSAYAMVQEISYPDFLQPLQIYKKNPNMLSNAEFSTIDKIQSDILLSSHRNEYLPLFLNYLEKRQECLRQNAKKKLTDKITLIKEILQKETKQEIFEQITPTFIPPASQLLSTYNNNKGLIENTIEDLSQKQKTIESNFTKKQESIAQIIRDIKNNEEELVRLTTEFTATIKNNNAYTSQLQNNLVNRRNSLELLNEEKNQLLMQLKEYENVMKAYNFPLKTSSLNSSFSPQVLPLDINTSSSNSISSVQALSVDVNTSSSLNLQQYIQEKDDVVMSTEIDKDQSATKTDLMDYEKIDLNTTTILENHISPASTKNKKNYWISKRLF